MKILVIGNGGREHALAWKFAESPSVERVFVAPGNPGAGLEAKCENVAIGVMDFDALTAFASSQSIDLTVVGPEAPLVAGIREAFDAKGLLCLAPSQAAARLEGSKRFAKEFMVRHHIPTNHLNYHYHYYRNQHKSYYLQLPWQGDFYRHP